MDEPDYEVLPTGGRIARTALPLIAVLVAAGIVVVGASLFWWIRQVDPPGDPGAQLASVVIPDGSTSSEIGEQLQELNVITSSRAFDYYVRFRRSGDWKAGEYVMFRERMSMGDVIDILDGGPVPPEEAAITVIPGTRLVDALGVIAGAYPTMTVEQLQQILASGQITSQYLPAGQTNWEGMIIAETNQFDDQATAQEILQTLVDQFDAQLTELGYERAEALTGHTAYELITVASMIEREAGQPADEKAKIARVIFNRLDQGIPLGVDATSLYGLGRTSGELSAADLDVDSPYNTRKNKGLPPTPIAIASVDSLKAAIDPVAGDWLYYVLESADPPQHFFTASYSEFEAAKERAKKDGVF